MTLPARLPASSPPPTITPRPARPSATDAAWLRLSFSPRIIRPSSAARIGEQEERKSAFATVVVFMLTMKAIELMVSDKATKTPIRPIEERRARIGSRPWDLRISAKAQAMPRLRQVKNCQELRSGANLRKTPVKLQDSPAASTNSAPAGKPGCEAASASETLMRTSSFLLLQAEPRARLCSGRDRRAHALDDLASPLDQRAVTRRHATVEPDVVLQP